MKIEQNHVRFLREGLANLAKLGNPEVTRRCIAALRAYAAAIRPYCECEERALVPAEAKEACLDCGKRHPMKEEKSDDISE